MHTGRHNGDIYVYTLDAIAAAHGIPVIYMYTHTGDICVCTLDGIPVIYVYIHTLDAIAPANTGDIYVYTHKHAPARTHAHTHRVKLHMRNGWADNLGCYIIYIPVVYLGCYIY